MSTLASSVDSVDGLRDSLAGLSLLFRSEADESDRIHRPTPLVQQALRRSGVLRLLLPKEFGGLEASPPVIVEVIETIAHADASVAWLVRALISETAVAASRLTFSTAADLFSTPGSAVIAGVSRGESGVGALLDDGSVRISGRWRYVPGISMASHVNLPVRVPGVPTLVCVVARSEVTVNDNWEMLGLSASGAFDVEARDVVVPGHLTFPRDGSFVSRGNHVDRLGAPILASINQAAWAQGIARRLLDELASYVEHRPQGRSGVLPEEFFVDFARHHAQVRSNRILLEDSLRSAQDALETGKKLPDEVETIIRLAGGLSTQSAVDISQFAHRFAGVHIVRNGPLQRIFRDAHTGAQHRGSSTAVARHAGMLLSGSLASGSGWSRFDAVHTSGPDADEVGE